MHDVKNVFQVGVPVSKENMIGYTNYLNDLFDLVSVKNNISIVGVRKTGKTSIVQAIAKQYEKMNSRNGACIQINLGLCDSFDDFCKLLVENLIEIIEDRHTLNTSSIQSKLIELQNNCKYNDIKSMQNITHVFRSLTSHIECYIIIDEFDTASNIFTPPKHYQFIRGLSDKANVRLITVSRRPIYVVEKMKDPTNSILHGIMKSFYIAGFDEENIVEYYNVLNDAYGIALSDEQKRKLHYYAGSSPYIYSMFGQQLFLQKRNNDTIDVDKAIRKCNPELDEYKKSIYQILLTDYIKREDGLEEVCTAEKLMSVVYGPTLNLTNGDITKLKEQGYLYSYERNGKEYYGALSEDFTEFLGQQGYSSDSWKLILSVERNCKLMVRRAMQRRIGQEEITFSEWSELFSKAGHGQNVSVNESFIDKTRTSYGKELDLLDVTSLEVVVSIIHVDWEKEYKQYFHDDPWEGWGKKLEMCAWARNPYAHGHGEQLLTAEESNQVNRYCEEIIKALEDSGACNDIEAGGLLHEDRLRKDVRKQYYDIIDASISTFKQDMEGESIIFIAAIENSKGIKGFFKYKGTYYSASVGKDKWRVVSNGQSRLDIHIGGKFSAMIETVNVSKNSINIRIIKRIGDA